MRKISFVAAGVMMVLFGACSHNNWTVEGRIDGAEGKELILEAANESGAWYGVDTVTVSDDGRYSFRGEVVGHPEIYRLRLGEQSAYFPIDSIETITLDGKVDNFANGYTLSGSAEAEAMQLVNQMVDSVSRTSAGQSAVFDEGFKRRLSAIVLRNPSGMTAYYAIFRSVGNMRVFDPSVPFDNRIIGAVANAFNERRPSDPRTAMLASLFLSNRQRPVAPTDTIMAVEISHPDINLADVSGTMRPLSAETGRGKVVIVNFTAYSAEESPAINVALAKVYEAHKGGLQIYQVGFDDDEYLWRQSAKNIPWIAVYNPPSAGARTLMDFNVGALPATFIINRNGDLVERVTDLSRLESAVAKYL